ncbi:oligosaccharide flippase family protein [Frigoribacterium salinisoli]
MSGRPPGGWSSNVLLTMVGNSFAPLAALATAPVLAQSLGVFGRGQVAGAIAPLLLASTVATLGIPAAVNYSVARHPALLRRVLSRAAVVLLVSGLVASASVFLLVGFLSDGDPALGQLIAVAAAAVVPTVLTGLLQAAASGLHLWRCVSRERFISALVRLVAIVFLAVAGELDVFRAVVVLAVSPVLGSLAYGPVLALLWSHSTPRDDVPGDGGRTGELFTYGLRVWVGSMSGVLLTRLDQTLMVPLSSEVQLGLYVVAVTVADLPLIITNAVRDVTFSSDAAKANDARLGMAARISTLAALVVCGGLAASCWWWIPLLFGDDFAGSVPVCLILLLSVVLGTPGSLAGIALSSRGSPQLRSTSLLVACVVNIVLLLLLVPVMGAVGAAVSTLVGTIAAANLNVLFLRRRFGIPATAFYGFRADDVSTLLARLRRKDR